MTMTIHDITIEGMNCQHCVAAVKRELLKIPLLTLDDVQIGKATVHYDEAQVDESALRKAVDDAGFQLIAIQ